MNKYNILKILNKKAINNDDVPVSCLIIKDGKIISKAYNKRNKNKNPFDHAEIIAIQKASKKLKTYNLSDCVLYTTLKPCSMCEEVIKESKIKKVYYILEKTKEVKNIIKYEKIDDINKYFEQEIKSFFKEKR
ncbi:MAG: nucleoside deaminase [Bacilli bacterium]|nr:nucleoside deaminase [Bacilli bacterium]